MPKQLYPTVVVAGFPKAGTTSLHRWLADHPGVGASSVKQTQYFCDLDWFHVNPLANFNTHGLGRYGQFFAHLDGTETCIVESSVDYVYQSTALEHLPDLPTKPMFVFVVREPAAQLLSLFRYFRNNLWSVDRSLSFSDFVELARVNSEKLGSNRLLREAISNCRYVEHLEAWTDRCGADRIRVFLFEDLVRENQETMRAVAVALGLDPGFYDDYGFPVENETYQVRSSGVHSLARGINSVLPATAFSNGLRKIYRKLNTSARGGTSDAERSTLEKLRREFERPNARLAARHGLDLSAWSGLPQPHS